MNMNDDASVELFGRPAMFMQQLAKCGMSPEMIAYEGYKYAQLLQTDREQALIMVVATEITQSALLSSGLHPEQIKKALPQERIVQCP